MADEIYVFVEPHPTGGDCTVEITRSKAIKFQKRYAKIQHKCYYTSDQEALDDFIDIHLAWRKKDDTTRSTTTQQTS